ncbi:hypothetical protein GNZ12_37360 [Paraburkholderia sp. 1N]|uniref:Uncharacterized protein n=1 Tax=Paraburkholderia solitsugae TaxID=2675748 RepID=A0ABX2C1G4_9BURK|nr:hypothetical protein [Paraburkholderia solitsugae]NPT46881.1 hypothetical protein [Paraburkholderia solitsugae]
MKCIIATAALALTFTGAHAKVIGQMQEGAAATITFTDLACKGGALSPPALKSAPGYSVFMIGGGKMVLSGCWTEYSGAIKVVWQGVSNGNGLAVFGGIQEAQFDKSVISSFEPSESVNGPLEPTQAPVPEYHMPPPLPAAEVAKREAAGKVKARLEAYGAIARKAGLAYEADAGKGLVQFTTARCSAADGVGNLAVYLTASFQVTGVGCWTESESKVTINWVPMDSHQKAQSGYISVDKLTKFGN